MQKSYYGNYPVGSMAIYSPQDGEVIFTHTAPNIWTVTKTNNTHWEMGEELTPDSYEGFLDLFRKDKMIIPFTLYYEKLNNLNNYNYGTNKKSSKA